MSLAWNNNGWRIYKSAINLPWLHYRTVQWTILARFQFSRQICLKKNESISIWLIKNKTAKQCIGKHKQKYEPRTKVCACRMSLSHAYAREFNARISLWMMISHRWSNNNMMITMECCGMCCCGGVDTLIVLVLHQMSSPEHYFAHFHSKYFIFVYILKWYWEQCNFLHDLFVWPLFCSVRKDAVIRMKYSSIIIF